MEEKEIIKISELKFSYNKGKYVIDNLSKTFHTGKIYTILGSSGCGKTTLLSLLGGLDVPEGGEIYFEGTKVDSKKLHEHRKNHISFIFQNYNLIDYMSAKENVELVEKNGSEEILKQVGLKEDEIKRNVLKLSGGQQQRVAIARALIGKAPVILADEPTGNLDEDTKLEIMNLLKNMAEKFNKCVIIVTHSREVAAFADEVLYLSQGKFSSDGIIKNSKEFE